MRGTIRSPHCGTSTEAEIAHETAGAGPIARPPLVFFLKCESRMMNAQLAPSFTAASSRIEGSATDKNFGVKNIMSSHLGGENIAGG